MIEGFLLFALGAMIFWGIGDFLIQRTIRLIGNVQTLCWIGIVGCICFFPFVVKDFATLSRADYIFLAILGALTFFCAILNFEALKKGKISVVDVILTIELPITVLLGVFIFQEILSLVQVACIVITLLGLVLLSISDFNQWKDFEKGVWLALLGGISMGVLNFMTAGAAMQISPVMAIWGPYLIFTILCLVIVWKRNSFSGFLANATKHKKIIFFTGLIDTLAWVLYAMSVSGGNVAVITAITESYPVIALGLGVWLNGERIKPHQYLGALLGLGSSIVLALTL